MFIHKKHLNGKTKGKKTQLIDRPVLLGKTTLSKVIEFFFFFFRVSLLIQTSDLFSGESTSSILRFSQHRGKEYQRGGCSKKPYGTQD